MHGSCLVELEEGDIARLAPDHIHRYKINRAIGALQVDLLPSCKDAATQKLEAKMAGSPSEAPSAPPLEEDECDGGQEAGPPSYDEAATTEEATTAGGGTSGLAESSGTCSGTSVCVLCMVRPAEVLVQPCGHLCLCQV